MCEVENFIGLFLKWEMISASYCGKLFPAVRMHDELESRVVSSVREPSVVRDPVWRITGKIIRTTIMLITYARI